VISDPAQDQAVAAPIKLVDEPARTSIARIHAALDAHVWTGPGALQDRLTLRSTLAKADKVGRIADLNVSVREVAAWTGCHPSTASRSLRRLITAGWITPGSNNYTGTVRVSSRGWSFVVPTEEPLNHNHRPSDSSHITPFVASGVGRAAGYVYERLSDEPSSVVQLATKWKRTSERFGGTSLGSRAMDSRDATRPDGSEVTRTRRR
jgi:hypothetical protein